MIGYRLLAICLLLSITIETAIAQQIQQMPERNSGPQNGQAAPQSYMNGQPLNAQSVPQSYMSGQQNGQTAPQTYMNGQPLNTQSYMNGQPLNAQALQSYMSGQQNGQTAPQTYMNWQQNGQPYPTNYVAPQPQLPLQPVGFNAPVMPFGSGAIPATAPPTFGIDGPLVERKVKAGDSFVTVQVPAISGEAQTGGVDVDKRWAKSKMPLRVYIKKGDGVPRYQPGYYDLLKECCHEWEVATAGKVRFVFVDSAADCDINVNWIEYGRNIGRDHACGTTKFFSANGYVLATKVYLATTMPDRWLEGTQDAHTMRHTILHEIGHSLGLTHSPFNTDIMYFQSNARKRVMVQGIFPVNIPLPVNISANDWRRINTLYP